MKENALFSFIWTGPVVLIAPDSVLVDTGGEFTKPPFFRRGQPHKFRGFLAMLDNSPPVSLLGLGRVVLEMGNVLRQLSSWDAELAQGEVMKAYGVFE
jgi:hypothetical protein